MAEEHVPVGEQSQHFFTRETATECLFLSPWRCQVCQQPILQFKIPLTGETGGRRRAKREPRSAEKDKSGRNMRPATTFSSFSSYPASSLPQLFRCVLGNRHRTRPSVKLAFQWLRMRVGGKEGGNIGRNLTINLLHLTISIKTLPPCMEEQGLSLPNTTRADSPLPSCDAKSVVHKPFGCWARREFPLDPLAVEASTPACSTLPEIVYTEGLLTLLLSLGYHRIGIGCFVPA